MSVCCLLSVVFEDEPFGLHASLLPAVEGAVAEVVEDAFHAAVVLSADVVLDGGGVDGAVGDVLVG